MEDVARSWERRGERKEEEGEKKGKEMKEALMLEKKEGKRTEFGCPPHHLSKCEI